MQKVKKSIVFLIFKLLPSTRCYFLKAKLLRLLGFNVSNRARIVSSVKFLGIENISIGDDTFIGHNTFISGSHNSSVTIGSYCDISSGVTIVTGTHKIDVEGKHIAGKGLSKNIIIQNGTWIGINATILPGVTIGEKSIVAAGSVVTKDVPSYVMVAGNPAIVKKYLKGGK